MNKHFETFFQSDRTAYDLAIQRNIISFVFKAYDNEDMPDTEDQPWEYLRDTSENIEAVITDRYFAWLASILNTTPIHRDSDEAYEIYDQMSAFMSNRVPQKFLDPGQAIYLLDYTKP